MSSSGRPSSNESLPMSPLFDPSDSTIRVKRAPAAFRYQTPTGLLGSGNR